MSNSESMDIDEMLKIAQMFGMLQKDTVTNDAKKILQEAVENKKRLDVEFFDENILTPDMKMLKAAIPFMDNNYQRSLGVFIKLVELQKIMEMYSGLAVNVKGQPSDWRMGMLNAMRPHLDDEKQDMVDVLISMMSVKAARDRMTGRRKNVRFQ